MAGTTAERQEQGLVDSIKNAVKKNKNNPVTLVAGKEGTISITGDENIISHVVTEVENNELKIYFEKKNWRRWGRLWSLRFCKCGLVK